MTAWGKSEDEFNNRQKCRERYIINNGFKIIRIVSRKDLLPDDIQLTSVINKAIELTNINNVIIIDIDNNYIKCNNDMYNVKFKNY